MKLVHPLRMAFALGALASLVSAHSVRASAATITRATLPNGLRIVLAPDPSATALDAALWFPAGSRHEPAAQAGIALLAARLAFRHGADAPLAMLTAVGGDGTLIATPDYTSFGASVPPEGLGRALGFLANRLTSRTTSAKELAGERSALRSDRGRSDRSPVARSLVRLWAAAWPGHAYANTGAEPSPGALAITPASVDAWQRSRLCASNATLTLTGAFDPDSAIAAIRARFGALARTVAPGAVPSATPRPALRARARMDIPVRVYFVGWRAPGAGDPDAAALEVLAAWLGGQPRARLGRVMTEDWKLAIATQAGFVAQREGSLLWTMAAVTEEADSGAVETTLLDAVTGVTRTAPDPAEIERARRQVETSTLFALQTARQRAQALGEAEMLTGDAAAAERRIEALRRVTAADVQRAAARVMTAAARATLWVMPENTGGAR